MKSCVLLMIACIFAFSLSSWPCQIRCWGHPVSWRYQSAGELAVSEYRWCGKSLSLVLKSRDMCYEMVYSNVLLMTVKMFDDCSMKARRENTS